MDAQDTITPSLETALKFHQAGQLDAAMDAYQTILETQRNHPDALQLLGIAAGQSGDLALSRACFERALANRPEDSALMGNFATLLKKLGENTQAEKLFQQSIKLDPSNPATLNNLGALQFQEGKLEAAKISFKNALKLKPDYADAHFNLACTQQKMDHQAKAIESFKACLQYEPQHDGAHHQLGLVAQLNDEIDQATAHFMACIKTNPQHATALQNLGAIMLKDNKQQDALNYFKRAVEADPSHPEAHHNLASLYLHQGQLALALKHYMAVLDQQQDLDTYYNIATTLMHLDRHNDALDYFKSALKIDPKHLNTHLNMAAVYLKKRERMPAIEHYQTVLTLEPDNQEVQYLLAALGNTPDVDYSAAPNAYVEHLFDQYAGHFDTHLNKFLDYQVPAQIEAVMAKRLALPQSAHLKILDLGCGTGLCGLKLKPWAIELIGIDLSQKMLDKAKEKSIYHQLECLDLLSALNQFQDNDLIIAGDVLPYLGKLDSIFEAVNGALRKNGHFVFTVEAFTLDTEEGNKDYTLQASARFAHRQSYIEQALQTAGLKLISLQSIRLREDAGQSIMGYLVCCGGGK